MPNINEKREAVQAIRDEIASLHGSYTMDDDCPFRARREVLLAQLDDLLVG